MSNPYQSPWSDSKTFSSGENFQTPDRGLIGHIRVIAILMMVQGGLQIALGLFLGVFAFLMPEIMEQANRQQMQQQPGAPDMAELGEWMLVLYGGLAAVNIVLGSLLVYSGFCNYRLRGRVLGIVALSASLLSVLAGCYCFPTALALMIYGLIVYLNGPVVSAFEHVSRGNSADSVL